MKRLDDTWRVAFRVAVVYAFFSSLWILLSDQIVLLLFRNPVHLTSVQSVKGWAFVITSALVIFVLLRRELKKLELTQFALADQKQFLNAMLDHSPTMMYMKDCDGKYLTANRRFCESFNLTPLELEGKTDHDIYPAEVAKTLVENDRYVLESNTVSDFREDVPRADGTINAYLTVKFPVYDRDGVVIGIWGISSDITNRLELEQELRRTEHMGALGRLTAGIAHDFNNHLTVVRGNLELLGASIAPGSSDERCLLDAMHASTQAAGLVDRLLSFSRKQILNVETVDINVIVNEMHELLIRSLEESIHFRIEATPGELYCRVDTVQFESALLNLAVNARDAMPGGGRLTLRTLRETVAPERARRDDIAPGAYIRVEIEDTGEGIAKELLSNVFEPFFTTKEPGRGTGLGLSMVDGFARQSGGCTRIRSKPGQGTCITILLPCSGDTGPTRATAVEVATTEYRPFGGTVLVVEDQAALRTLAEKVLAKHGYTVLTSEDGVEAKALMETAGPIDLLFSDVVLPNGIMGPEVAKAYLACNPKGRVLLASGYADRDLLCDADATCAYPILRKPYGVAEMLSTVAKVLGSETAPDSKSQAPES